jgi:hypothetical protein
VSVETVIASEAKQSTAASKKAGLLRRFAPRNDTNQITVSRNTLRQSISYSRSITGGRAKCQVRPERVAPRRTSSSAMTG